MNARDVLTGLVGYAETNRISNLLPLAPYLQLLAEHFGARDTDEITAREVAEYLRSGHLLDALGGLYAPIASSWEPRYARRFAADSREPGLPWERAAPAEPLEKLFAGRRFDGARALDLGCGDGTNAVFMARAGCRVTAVDVSASAIDEVRRRAATAGVEVEVHVADVLRLDLPAGSFDLVFDRGCLHHLPVIYFDQLQARVAGWLAAGGTFQLLCHSVEMDPAFLLVHCFLGSLGKLLAYVGLGVAESGFTEREIHQIFGERFAIESVDRFVEKTAGPDHVSLACLMTRR